uniref:Uncharacterized protein n=1 Tax=Arundo donax TaxID=35708 RepID=A0A0A9AKH7_ARUDO
MPDSLPGCFLLSLLRLASQRRRSLLFSPPASFPFFLVLPCLSLPCPLPDRPQPLRGRSAAPANGGGAGGDGGGGHCLALLASSPPILPLFFLSPSLFSTFGKAWATPCHPEAPCRLGDALKTML